MLFICKNYQLKDILFYKIPVIADYFVKTHSADQIIEVFEFCYKNKIEQILPLGLGSNILFKGQRFKGLVFQIVSNNKENSRNIVRYGDNKFIVFGGVVLADFIKYAFQQGFIGLEWAGGLPGTIGAGVRGNVGAFGGEIKDIVISADIIWRNKNESNTFIIKQQTLPKEKLKFRYRDSLIKKTKGVVLSVVLELKKGNSISLKKALREYNDHIKYRKIHHPLEYPNCGSVFKNITNKERIEVILKKWPDIKVEVENKWRGKIPIGYIINRFNLAGLKSGGARISKKHANFIINTGGAKAHDILDLIQRVKDKFLMEFGFEPEIEIEII